MQLCHKEPGVERVREGAFWNTESRRGFSQYMNTHTHTQKPALNPNYITTTYSSQVLEPSLASQKQPVKCHINQLVTCGINQSGGENVPVGLSEEPVREAQRWRQEGGPGSAWVWTRTLILQSNTSSQTQTKPTPKTLHWTVLVVIQL